MRTLNLTFADPYSLCNDKTFQVNLAWASPPSSTPSLPRISSTPRDAPSLTSLLARLSRSTPSPRVSVLESNSLLLSTDSFFDLVQIPTAHFLRHGQRSPNGARVDTFMFLFSLPLSNSLHFIFLMHSRFISDWALAFFYPKFDACWLCEVVL